MQQAEHISMGPKDPLIHNTAIPSEHPVHVDTYMSPPPHYAQAPPQYVSSPPQYVQAPQQYQSTTVIQAPTGKLTGLPTMTQCPNCRSNVTTKTNKVVGVGNFLAAGVCVLIGCVGGCCLIPFCVDDLKDTEHSCPACHSHIGKASML
ncbi:lipopolysaccharide-induced tumor necrosis factor LITAF [Acrasis kona]|uniref:Lipopolysaccharide-induced tumor necrosis factor LITAF n=1 Tax=Acrasis kona TaxID=1008807 RepID=A0AAW2Z8E6_9EUKA